MKKICSMSLMVAVVALLITSAPVHASKKDRGIESSAKQSYVFQTYLKSHDIKIRSMDGVVTLTGSVSEESHKSLAQETVEGLPDVKRVDNRLEVKGGRPSEKSNDEYTAKVKTLLLLLMCMSSR
jgi:hyperosmotically inducible protein